jgi:hypothetical protein
MSGFGTKLVYNFERRMTAIAVQPTVRDKSSTIRNKLKARMNLTSHDSCRVIVVKNDLASPKNHKTVIQRFDK